MKKRFLSILTALCLTLTLLPTAALAEGEDGENESTETTIGVVQGSDGKSYTSIQAAVKEGQTELTLIGDTSLDITEWPTEGSLVIDLNQNTITITNTKNAKVGIAVPENETLTLKNGSIKAEQQFDGAHSVFVPKADATIVLDHITMVTNGTALYPAGNAAEVVVRDSTITAGCYAIGTNASMDSDGDLLYSSAVKISLENSTISTTGYKNNDGDDCTILLNVPGTLTIDNCKITGHRVAVLVRGGEATIRNSEINLSDVFNGEDKDDYNENWGSGNAVPMGALIVGNQSQNAYKYSASCTLIDTKVTAEDGARGAYVYGIDKDSRSAGLTVEGESKITVSGDAESIKIAGEGSQAVVTGGTFSTDVSQYFPEDVSLKWDENTNQVVTDTKTAVAEVNGVPYSSLEAAIKAAPAGATVTLVADAVLDANGKNDSEGALTITKDIILDGGNYTITAKNVTLDGEKGPSMINVQGNAKVTIKNVTINGKASGEGSNATKHGINIYGADVTLQNVEVQNNRWYAVVNNGGNLTVNGLTTTGNQWGINMDNRASASSLNITTASISEASSIVFDKTKETQVTATISGGNYQYIVMNSEDAKANTSLTISGGTYGTGSISNSVNIADYLAPGLSWNPSNGAVYDPSQNQSSSGSSSDPSYSPILDVSDGGSIKVNPRTPEEDDEVTITVDPDSGYEVDEVTVTDRNGREVKVTAERDGTYTFTQPRGRVTISVTFVREGGSTFFSDVPESFWAYDEIAWAYDNGYVNGTSASAFSPNASISRQQVWMILARLSGADPANMSAAREWAVTNGVSDGTTPGGAVTRQQLVALLYRYATLMGYANDQRADLSAYPDAGTVAGYAVEPMQWSVANSIVGGTSNGTLDPTGTATRAQFAVILYRFWDQVG